MGKATIRIAHVLISILAGALMAYSFYYIRSSHNIWESVGAGVLVFIMAMLLLPKLHRGGGGGGDF